MINNLPPRGELATVAFQAEAHESAARFLRELAPQNEHDMGYAVTAVPYDEPPFDAELVDIVTGEDGQYKVVLAPCCSDRANARTLDIYDDLQRIEVL